MTDMEVGNEPMSNEAEPKMYNDVQVNDIVKREKARAAERARAEIEAKYAAEIEKLRGESSGSSTVDTSKLKEQVLNDLYADLEKRQQEAEEQERKGQLQHIADQYRLKMAKKPEHIEDYDEIMADFSPADFPSAVMLAAGFDNVPEIMHELASNPTKLAQIDTLARQSPGLAKKELERLSKSIQTNMAAKQNHVSAPAPLSRTKSSNVGADNGVMTLKDMKTAPWLRA
jgi:hypothetical protein